MMRVWQKKETVSVSPLAWSPPVSVSSPASTLLLCAQPINCTMKQDKWELPARQRLMSFEPICTHSINKGGDQKAWSISIDSVVQSDSVPALRCVICGLRKPLSVAIRLWLEVYDEEALNLFRFFLQAMSSSNEQLHQQLWHLFCRKDPTDYMSITTKSPESW